MFVAGFIGSPAMNFPETTVTGDENEMYLDADTFRVAVPAQYVSMLKPYLGGKVILGIRPEHIHDPAYTPPDIVASPIQARVDVTELMGNELFLHLVSGDQRFLARVDPRTAARPGQDIDIAFDMANMHAFDPETGRAIRG